MKKYLFITGFCLLAANTIFGQGTFSGSFDFKNQTAFSLVSGNDSVTVQVAKKQIALNAATGNLFGVKKTGRKHLLYFNNGDTIQITRTKRELAFQPGLIFTCKERTSRKLTLADADGQTVLKAAYDFRYPVASYIIHVHDSIRFRELLSYATYYLFENSKELKTAYETPFIYFGSY